MSFSAQSQAWVWRVSCQLFNCIGGDLYSTVSVMICVWFLPLNSRNRCEITSDKFSSIRRWTLKKKTSKDIYFSWRNVIFKKLIFVIFWGNRRFFLDFQIFDFSISRFSIFRFRFWKKIQKKSQKKYFCWKYFFDMKKLIFFYDFFFLKHTPVLGESI